MNTIAKKTDHAFNKDIYLLGRDADGINYWLEAPSWDCGWYWGFGYVEAYTNNAAPRFSRDIRSHQHVDGFLFKDENGKQVSNVFDNPILPEKTFTQSEGWLLTELFRQFYLLQEMAEFAHKDRPGCHVTTSPVDHGDLKDWCDKINKVMIPAITAKIIEILSPVG